MGKTSLLSGVIQVSKPTFLLDSLENCGREFVWVFCLLFVFLARCLGREPAQIFLVIPVPIFLSGKSASYSLEICLWIFEETVMGICVLNIRDLQEIL